CLGECACGVDDVIHQDDVSAFHVSDYGHAVDLVSLLAMLIADHHFSIEVLGIPAGPVHAAHIRRCNGKVWEFQRFDIRYKERRWLEVVDRKVEEPLDLRCMQVHRHDPCNPCGAKQVGDQFGG